MTRRIAYPRLRVVLPGALFALVTLFLVSTSGAAPGSTPKKHRPRKSAATLRKPVKAPVAPGMRAVIDPVTGRLTRPTVDDANPTQAPGQAAAKVTPDEDATRGIAVIRLANGTEMARLDDRFQEFEVVKVGADGKLIRACVQGKDGVQKFRAAPTPAAPAREVK
jgi:hypothetical protein